MSGSLVTAEQSSLAVADVAAAMGMAVDSIVTLAGLFAFLYFGKRIMGMLEKAVSGKK